MLRGAAARLFARGRALGSCGLLALSFRAHRAADAAHPLDDLLGGHPLLDELELNPPLGYRAGEAIHWAMLAQLGRQRARPVGVEVGEGGLGHLERVATLAWRAHHQP